MVSSFCRKWPTLLKYAAIGATAFIFSASPVLAQDARQQQLDAVNARLEKLEKQNQMLMQLLEQQKQQSVVPAGMQPASVSSQSDDVKKTVEKILKDKEDAKKAEDEKKKKEAVEKGHEVGSDLKYGNATWDRGIKFETPEKDFSMKLSGRFNFDSVFWRASDKMQLPNNQAGAPAFPPNTTGVGRGVGLLDDGMFFRRIRLQSEGTFYEQYEYNAEIDFEGLNLILFDNLYVGMKDLPLLGTVRVGQMKIPMGLESYSSSKNLMMMERSGLFDAFWNEFGVGVYATNTMFDERATWHAMFGRIETFTPASGSDFGDGDYAFTSRITALPRYEADGRCLVHVGASYQWRRADEGRNAAQGGTGNAYADTQHVVRFRDRPELRDAIGSNFAAEGDASRFIDTGNILADNVNTFAGEFLTIQGPLTIQSEATIAQVQNARYPATLAHTDRGNPTFWGAYGEVAYCLTGENRSYDKRFGAVGTIKPNEPFFAVRDENGCLHSGWGAWELCYRFSVVDLNNADSNILGGKLTENTVGINWWLAQNMRLQANYLNIYRDVISPATSGTVHALGLRAILEF